MKARDVIGLFVLAGGATLFAVRSGWIKLGAGKEEAAEAAVTGSSSPSPRPPASPPPAAPVVPSAPKPDAGARFFATPWQEESQFIVQTIAADLAEMMTFAKTGQPPTRDGVKIRVHDADFQNGFWVYQVELPDLQIVQNLPITDAIWSAANYQPLAQALMGKLGLKASAKAPSGSALAELTELRATVIEKANADVSAALQKDFASPALHERAALVLGAFALREHSRLFFEIRSELCAMTAHLAVAQALRGGSEPSLEGRVAEATLTTLFNNQTDAMKLIDRLPGDAPGLAAWTRALRIRNTGDYRLLKDQSDPSLLERLEQFKARAERIDADQTWEEMARLPKQWQTLADWERITSSVTYSVETGHQLLRLSLPVELQEIADVYALAKGVALPADQLVAALNEEPGRCVTIASDGQAQVRVIGWGLWGNFLQRRLCQAMTENFRFMSKMWGVPDEARQFRDSIDAKFSGLRLYPFVRRQNATDEAYYHQAQDDSMALIRRQPQLVPAHVWNYVAYNVSFGPMYIPPPHPYLNEWHRYNPPPGTAYDPYPRMNHPSLMNRPDTVALLERLHAIAPWDHDIAFFLIRKRDGEQPTSEQLQAGYRPELEYAVSPMTFIAHANENNPPVFLQWMSRAAALHPRAYYSLGNYLAKLDRRDEAAQAYTNAITLSGDDLNMAAVANWMVNYLEDHGETARATELANRAAEVYSVSGLQAKANLFERRHAYRQAFEVHQALAERYNDAGEAVPFLVRMRAIALTPQDKAAFAAALTKALPGGLEKLDPTKLAGAPTDGLVLTAENAETKKAGLRMTDVIVGVQGYRTRTSRAYTALREMEGSAPLRIVLWRDNAYLTLTATPPGHLFGVALRDYRP